MLKTKFTISMMATLMMMFMLVACNSSNHSKNGDAQSVEDSTDQLITEEIVPIMGFDCADLSPETFCSMGFDFIRIGDTLMWRDLQVPEIASIKDSVLVAELEGDTIAANIRTISFPDGKIVLESDWQDAMYLNRIQVTTPQYSTTSGLKVGSTVADLRAIYPELQARSFPEYGVDEIFATEKNGNPYMIFQVEDPNQEFVNPNDSSWSAAGIPDAAAIVRIVVM